MIRLQQHKDTRKRKQGIIVAAFIIIAFLLLQSQAVFGALSQMSVSVAGFFWEGKEEVLNGLNENRISSQQDELTTLRMRSLSRELLLEENRELKALLGRRNIEKETILGVVLVKPNQTPYDTFIIDIGSRDGVSQGARVMAYGDITLGEVEEVYTNTSRVRLYSSPGEEIQVLVGKDTIQATAQGRGGGNFIIELPQGVDVEEGDSISFPSITTQLVGVIEEIQKKPSSSFQAIYFKNPVNLHELRWVEVIK